MMTDEDLTGKRLLLDGYFGTIRFQGSIVGKKGFWLGIEWDKPERGKHNGEYQGTQFFTVSVPGTGSFIPLNAPFSLGRSFVDAIIDKYTKDVPKDSMIYLGGDSSIEVETVGWEKIQRKQSNLHTLKEIGLSNLEISHLGSDETHESLNLEKLTVQDVDLSRNLIHSWENVAQIIQPLSCLELLRLSFNRLTFPSQGISLSHAFEKIKVLTITHSNLDWNDITRFAPWFTNLHEIHLSFNRVSTISSCESSFFPSLKVMNLEGNQISSWDDISHLGDLPNLTWLNLAYNPLNYICIKPSGKGSLFFPKLSSINLNYTQLSSWKDIHILNSFSSITELRLKGTDLEKNISNRDKRSILISRLSNIQVLNGSDVTKKERQDSELWYLRNCAQDLLDMPRAEFDELHPRYEELCEKYGTPVAAPAALVSNALKDRLVTISATHTNTNLTVQKKLPANMKIRAAKMLISKLLKANTRDITALQLELKNQDDTSEILDDLKDFGFYGIEAGKTYQINMIVNE